jgi:hypothetical protein
MTRAQIKDRFHEIASELMKDLDFTRIHHTMQALDWRYSGERQTEGDIRIFCRRLLHEAIESVLDSPSGEAFRESGGFEVSVYHPDHPDLDRNGTLDLRFTVEHDIVYFDKPDVNDNNKSIQEQIDEIVTRLDLLENEVDRYILNRKEVI